MKSKQQQNLILFDNVSDTTGDCMKHKVYMRDWYFNAGIIGFLATVADEKPVAEIDGLVIGDNFIEFENKVLEDFEEKFVKQAFFRFFKKGAYISRLEKHLKDVEKKKDIKPESLKKLILGY